jgi:hypothetical protein
MNVPCIYAETMIRMKLEGIDEESRNGTVLTCEDIFVLSLLDPQERVLFDPVRDANPFFHVMEFIWMMAGSNDVNWIARFNSNYRRYADGDIVHGAYGHRWKHHFGDVNQLTKVIDLLKRDRKSRRGVLGMWDPRVDLEPHNDLPCNTHAYFRIDSDDRINMTICSRSNDILWGMLGANVVHMTLLHELIARGVDEDMGMYQVVSNNAHIYKGLEKYEQIINTRDPVDPYHSKGVNPMPLLVGKETVVNFLTDAYEFVYHGGMDLKTKWFKEVAWPMRLAWEDREHRAHWIQRIQAEDWQLACAEWTARRAGSSTVPQVL